MKTLKNVGKRVVALVLALMMCVGMLSTTAFAAKETHSNDKYCTLCASGNHDWGVYWSHDHPEWGTSVTSRICKCCGAEDVYHAACVDHKYEAVVTPPTCTKDGYTTYTCNKVNLGKVCGASYTTAYVKATGVHTQDSGTVTTAATCLHEGEKTFKCTGCDMVMSTEPIALDANNHDADCHAESRGHNDTQHWVVLTCDVATNYQNHDFVGNVCNTCGYTKTTDPVTPPEHEHIWGEVQVEHPATCTSNATGKQDCTVAGCNASRDNVEVEGTMLGHSFTNKWIQKGTGHVKQCDRCEYTSATSYGAHTMGDWKDTVEATCTSEGKETRACTKCDYTESRPTPKAQHVYENGSCVNCGQPDPNSPCEHQWVRYDGEEVYKAPTCTDNGVEYIEKCSLCGAQKTYANTALGHDFQDVDGTNTATCTKAGQKEQKCSRCEATQIVEAEALGHRYSEKIDEIPATCTDAGMRAHYKCTREGCEALMDGTHVVKAEDLVIPATGEHTWSDWEAATDEHIGKECRECTVCGLHETRDPVTTTDPGTDPSADPSTSPSPAPTTPGTGDGGDVVIDDTNPPLGGDPDGGDGEVELDDIDVPLAGPVTRGEFVDYLYRREGAPDTALSTFVDVPADHDYANAVGWGQANNIAWGISETEFAPDELVTVEQVKLFLSRYAAFKGSEMPELAALVGLDDQDPAMNCDEILGEFFGADE